MAGATPNPSPDSGNAGPLVSVILPVYNGAPFVGQTIESALRQTHRNIEIIVVDDGSTDKTADIVQSCAARDARVRIVHQPNSGVARARNRGLECARGEFIAPLDADDLWDPAKIERQLERMRQEGEETGLVYCWWVWIDENGTILDRSPHWQVQGDAFQTLLQVNYTGNASVPLYRRSCLQEVGGYDETLEQRGGRGCEDWDVALRVAARYRVALVPELLVGYRRLAESMSTQCDVMWRSQKLIADGLRQREPDLTSELFRQSEDQFALYIAGVLFRTGAYFRAFLWAMRAWRTGLLFRVLPYVIAVFARRLFLLPRVPRTMAPGVGIEACNTPGPLIPYDRIYARRFGEGAGGPANPPAEDRPDPARPPVANRSRIGALLASRAWQTAMVAVAFLLIAAPHAGNDGLWFQGDSPRHAVNGFFWWDLIAAHPASAVDFAVRYYARYPVINPLAYPPLFYLLEGLAFRAIAPSPFAAKSLVLAFGVMAGIYTMLWARRWLGPQGGWAGAFLAFVPGIVVWTNAVMLNVPATAFGLACLYHGRRSIEECGGRKLAAAGGAGMAAVLTYYQGGIAVGICAVWMLLFHRYKGTPRRRWVWGVAIVPLIVFPVLLAARMAPLFAARHLPGIETLSNPKAWTFYLTSLPSLIGPVGLGLGLAGLAAAWVMARWRTEAAYLSCWIAAPIVAFSFLPARDARYILLVAPALVIAAAVGIAAIIRLLPPIRPGWRALMLGAGLAAGFWSAASAPIPQPSGFREVAEYLRAHAPLDPVLYDGYHDGLFGFYVRALDPKFERRIVLAQPLLYHYGPTKTFHWVETLRADSAQDAANLLRTSSGCRWIAVEVGSRSEWARGQRLLRQAVAGTEFERVRSFPLQAKDADRIDLYRLLGPVSPVSTVDLKLASYSDRTYPGVVPITR